MDWLRRMNGVLDYIESHLTEEVDYEEIGKISLCPSGLFQRMFSTITGFSLSEYIRRRKISKAAMELSEGKATVLEIAIKYGYESADAFGVAFKRVNEISPGQVRGKNVRLKHFPKLSFTMNLKGDLEMNYKLVKKPAFKVVGASIWTSQDENMKNQTIPQFWTACNTNGTSARLCEMAPGKPLLGVCCGEKPDGTFQYMVGVESEKNEKGLETLLIPKAEWAVFESVGPLPASIQKVWSDIFQNFLPSGNYDHADMPDFELYFEPGTRREDYHCEVWIPVIQKKQ